MLGDDPRRNFHPHEISDESLLKRHDPGIAETRASLRHVEFFRRDCGGECQIRDVVSLATRRQQLPDRQQPVRACVPSRRDSLLDERRYRNVRLQDEPTPQRARMAHNHHGTPERLSEVIQSYSDKDVPGSDWSVRGRLVIDVLVSEYLVLVGLGQVLGIRFIG